MNDGRGPDRPDDDAGPMVRPYVMTRGRLAPRGEIDLITQVVARTDAGFSPARRGLGPEQFAILQAATRPVSVAEIADRLDLPPSTVRVLLGDLLDEGLVLAQEPRPAEDVYDRDIYKAILDGLQKL